ncbi:MAG: response regulator transcription factor [Lentisphaeria bacterium]|nr:response regulator transcription factor [Lentisphaeria bacterium]
MDNVKILLAEDDQNIRSGLKDALELEEFEVIEAGDGVAALATYESAAPDLILLDIMMPRVNGYDVCRQIRKNNSNIPILMLTAKGEEIDKILGLELGADDYITKPFSLKELLARINAVLRRSRPGNQCSGSIDTPDEFCYGQLRISVSRCRASSPAGEVELTGRELELLKLFMQNPGKVIRREELLRCGWGNTYGSTTRTLDQHIAILRKKLENELRLPRQIESVYALGYRFE